MRRQRIITLCLHGATALTVVYWPSLGVPNGSLKSSGTRCRRPVAGAYIFPPSACFRHERIVPPEWRRSSSFHAFLNAFDLERRSLVDKRHRTKRNKGKQRREGNGTNRSDETRINAVHHRGSVLGSHVTMGGRDKAGLA